MHAVNAYRPTVMIGTTGQPGLFTEPIVRAMMAGTDRPIVMALSNPTSKCEANAADLVEWTAGRGILATGRDLATGLLPISRVLRTPRRSH